MLEEIKKQFTSIQILITLLIIAVGIYVFQNVWQILGNFSDIFVMLISAWLISFILEPIVDMIVQWTKMRKIVAALITYSLFLALLGAIVFLFIPIIAIQSHNLVVALPRYFALYPGFINKWGDLMSNSLSSSLLLVPSVASFFLSLFIVLIISFYFVVDKERINTELLNLIPKKWHKDVQFTQEVVNTTFASFLRVQLIFGLMTGFGTWIILTIFNVDFAASTAVFAGLLTMVPLLGPVLGIIPPVVVAFFIDPTRGLFVFIALLVVSQIIFNVIGPKLLGKAFKLHPVIILLSFFVGFKLAGGAGAIFAVPVLGIIVIVAHRLSRHFLHIEE